MVTDQYEEDHSIVYSITAFSNSNKKNKATVLLSFRRSTDCTAIILVAAPVST